VTERLLYPSASTTGLKPWDVFLTPKQRQLSYVNTANHYYYILQVLIKWLNSDTVLLIYEKSNPLWWLVSYINITFTWCTARRLKACRVLTEEHLEIFVQHPVVYSWNLKQFHKMTEHLYESYWGLWTVHTRLYSSSSASICSSFAFQTLGSKTVDKITIDSRFYKINGTCEDLGG